MMKKPRCFGRYKDQSKACKECELAGECSMELAKDILEGRHGVIMNLR